eukprot:935123-Pleurochrysis_carterae.AAC.1
MIRSCLKRDAELPYRSRGTTFGVERGEEGVEPEDFIASLRRGAKLFAHANLPNDSPIQLP